MEEHQAHEPAVELPPTRRKVYMWFIHGAMSLIGATLAVPAAIYLLFPPKARKEAEWVETADLASLLVGTPTEISFQRNRVDGWKVISEKATAWVVKQNDGQVIAFTPNCTHLGCAYHWDDASHTFVCPCHTSAFSIDGKVLGGPAPRPLDRYMVKIEAGKLEIGPPEAHA
jgi:menaquinol-cytochrome c reductase iron-sulfur subunit